MLDSCQKCVHKRLFDEHWLWLLYMVHAIAGWGAVVSWVLCKRAWGSVDC